MPKIIPLKVQKPSGFDLSFQNILTAKPGEIVPLVSHEVVPNTKVSLRSIMQASLPPLAFDTFMRVSLKVQAFFVPMRILCGSFENFFTQEKRKTAGGTEYVPVLPYFSVQLNDLPVGENIADYLGRGTLADYLGVKSSPSGFRYDPSAVSPRLELSMMPFLAYHKVYDDWFRNTRVQNSVFAPEDGSDVFQTAGVYSMPYAFVNTNNGSDVFNISDSYLNFEHGLLKFVDGHLIWDLRKCNFADDYFTICTPTASERAVSVNVSGGAFTIEALRGANALQIYADRHNLAGTRYIDRLRSDYGASLSEGVAQRSLLLGSGEVEVFSKGIYNNNTTNAPASNNNPFTSVGARYGDAYASGQLNLIDDFTAEEPGYIMVMCELVPRVTYGSGIDSKFKRYLGLGSITDMANPILQGIGNQPVFADELSTRDLEANPSSRKIFGFTERFANWKTKVDEVHGLVSEGQSLGSMVLQRNFDSNSVPAIGSAFLQVPSGYMDNVTAVTAQVSNYGYWLDSYFDFKVVQPLAPYSIPTLEDVANEHQRTVGIRAEGSRLP